MLIAHVVCVISVRTTRDYRQYGFLCSLVTSMALTECGINAVALHRARLVLGWVTAFG